LTGIVSPGGNRLGKPPAQAGLAAGEPGPHPAEARNGMTSARAVGLGAASSTVGQGDQFGGRWAAGAVRPSAVSKSIRCSGRGRSPLHTQGCRRGQRTALEADPDHAGGTGQRDCQIGLARLAATVLGAGQDRGAPVPVAAKASAMGSERRYSLSLGSP